MIGAKKNFFRFSRTDFKWVSVLSVKAGDELQLAKVGESGPPYGAAVVEDVHLDERHAAVSLWFCLPSGIDLNGDIEKLRWKHGRLQVCRNFYLYESVHIRKSASELAYERALQKFFKEDGK